MTTHDMTMYEGDPDTIVLETIDAYATGKANKADVEAALLLALEVPQTSWRPEIQHRYAALVLWATLPKELDAMLERTLNYRITVKSPRGVQ